MALDCRLPLPPIDFGPRRGPSFCHSSAAVVRPFVRSFDARKFWNNFRVPLVIRFFSLSLSLRFRSWKLGTRFRFRIQVARFHLVFAVVVVVRPPDIHLSRVSLRRSLKRCSA